MFHYLSSTKEIHYIMVFQLYIFVKQAKLFIPTNINTKR